MSSAASALSSMAAGASSSSTSNTPTTQSPLDPLANEQTFLKLLVSQLQNQDPLNPTDSNQFVSQLTSYSQLEQLIGIRQNTNPVAAPTAAGPGTSSTTTTTPAPPPGTILPAVSSIANAASKNLTSLGA